MQQTSSMNFSSYNSKHIATTGLFALLSALVLFHLLVVLHVIPFTVIWGGRITDNIQMITFEFISIIVNLIMLGVVAINAELVNVPIHTSVTKGALWVMFALFVLNTLGNVTSKNHYEKWIFTPVTLILSILCLLLAISHRKAAVR